MKIVIDLQCCQTDAATREVDDALSLVEALTRNGPEHDILFLLDRRRLSQSSALVRRIERFASLGDVVLFDHPGIEVEPDRRDLCEEIANVLRNDRIETLSADVHHIFSLFGGDGIAGPALPYLTLPKPPLVRSASFGDRLPAIASGADLPASIRRAMDVARQCDVGLATSEAIRQDAVRLIGLAPDRIVTLPGLGDAPSRALSVEQWDRSAKAALEAWAEARDKRRQRTSVAISRTTRIAMFTPLPPARSGIADYSAEFLRELRNFATLDVFVDDAADVDIDGVEIHHHTGFPERADRYDAIVYQLGNSPFHHYMAPYIEAYPGVVVMHDAYVGHLSHDPSRPDVFVRQVIRDHGGEARRILDDTSTLKEGAGILIDRLTCAPTHVYRSRGVIVHSAFARDLMRASTRPSIAPPIEVIPQFRAPIAEERRVGREKARALLGLPADAVLIGSFGHIAGTKGALELIAAFSRSAHAGSAGAKLVFVGELEGGPNGETPYARDVLRAVAGRRDILVTGYVSARDYDFHLQAMDIVVQLRTLTRGETSRALLDVMWSAVPLIYNRLGASSELPDAAAIALADHEPATIAAALDRLLADANLRAAQGRAGLAHMEETRDPDTIARAFVRSVLDMTERSLACGPSAVIETMARLLRPAPPDRELNAEIARAYVAQERSEEGPRLLIDIGPARQETATPQTKRIVTQLTHASYRALDGWRPRPFAFGENGLVLAEDFALACGARLPVEAPDAGAALVQPGPLDTMLLMAGSPHPAQLMEGPIGALTRLGGQVYGLVGDGATSHATGDWLALIAAQGDGIVCASRDEADALIALLRAAPVAPRAGFRIGHASLDADFAELFAFLAGRNDHVVFGGGP